MSATSPTRRDVLATTMAVGALSLLSQQMPEAAEANGAIRPFRINVPEDKARRPPPADRRDAMA